VFVYVDQRDAALVKVGQPAEIVVPYGGGVVPGRVSRLSGELDPRTRTMTVEIHLDNERGAIVPGSFVTVRLAISGGPRLQLPVEALVLRQQKTFVAVVTSQGRVQLRSVAIAQHDGSHVSLGSGVTEGERVALNPGRAIKDGDLVQPVSPPPPGPGNAPARK
jgi:hypothetical protein